MAFYEYRCARDGIVQISRPVGEARERERCPLCDDAVRRVFSAPMLSLASRAAGAAIDRAEKSRTEPDVVSSLPPRHPSKRTPTAPPNPALQRLPRP